MARLPNADRAVMEPEKLTGYLLSDSHADGAAKARFFKKFGFRRDDPERLGAALKAHAKENEVASLQTSPFGTKYEIVGPLRTPLGRSPIVVAIWIIETGQTVPRLVTAFPG